MIEAVGMEAGSLLFSESCGRRAGDGRMERGTLGPVWKKQEGGG